MRFTHQPGAQPLAGYTIQRGIHRGGFGEVYYAHSDGGKEVALKLLQREQDVELRGVRQCLNLKHSNLVNLFDVRTDAHGEQWVVMEYVNGSSLEDVLASFPNGLPLEEVREWLSGIVAGVAYLHDRGIVHRDLKPGNVYRENGTVKVGDVGLSKRLGSDRRGAHTQSVGTVYYMAPEVANGQYGPEVDVYSLGIMLYEMLTGRLPFMGESTAEVLMKHLTATASLDDIPEPLRLVVSRALAKDPQKRTPSAVQLNQEFQDALTSTRREVAPVIGGHAAFAVNGTATISRATMAETPSTGNGVRVDTVASIPAAGLPPAMKSAAQAASAYAQYPSDTRQSLPPIPVIVPQSPPPLPRTASVADAAPADPQDDLRPRRGPQSSSVSQAAPAYPRLNWPVVVMGIVGLALFAPGTWLAWAGLIVIGTACVIASIFRGRMGWLQVSSPTTRSAANSLYQAPGDAPAALAIGSVSATLLSVGTVFAAEFLQKRPQGPTPEFLALFTTTSVAATWLILLVGQFQRRFIWLEKNPRKAYLMVGVAVGALAFNLDQYLLVDYAKPSNYSPAFQVMGVHSLIEGNMNPTGLGYMVFFGGLMFWHRWWQDQSPRRNRPLSFGRLGTAAIAAWLLTVMFAFPQGPAILWAITISAAVQLAAPWTSERSPTSRRV